MANETEHHSGIAWLDRLADRAKRFQAWMIDIDNNKQNRHGLKYWLFVAFDWLFHIAFFCVAVYIAWNW